MADPIILSNKSSGLLSTLSKAKQTNDWTYRNKVNIPNTSKFPVSVSPNTTPTVTLASTQTVTFKIPAYSLIENMAIYTTFTNGNNDDSANINNSDIGFRLYTNIELRTHNNQICTQTPGSLESYVRSVDTCTSLNWRKMANNVSTCTANTSHNVVTPLHFVFFEKDAHWMRLSSDFLEDMELVLTVNNRTALGFGANLAAFSPTLQVWYRTLESNIRDAFWVSNFDKSKEFLSMLITDTYLDYQSVTNGTTTTTIDLKVPNAVIESHIYCSDTAEYSIVEATTQSTVVSFRCSGRPIYDSANYRVVEFDEIRYGKVNIAASTYLDAAANTLIRIAESKRHLSLFHGIQKGYLNNWSVISFQNLNKPQIVLTHTDPGNTTTTANVLHFFFRMMTIDTTNGVINVASSL